MKSIEERVQDNEPRLAARAAERDAAYRAELAGIRDELRPRADVSRRQIKELAAEQREAERVADHTDRLAQQIASLGDRGVAQTLANWAADIRTPFHGAARGGFGGGVAPLAESREHLAIFDDDTAFARTFTPAVLADINARRETVGAFRAALGRVDGYLGHVRSLRGRIEQLLQDYRNADPSPAGARIAPAVTRPEPQAPLRVETAFNLGPDQ